MTVVPDWAILPQPDAVSAAAVRLDGLVNRTPVLTSSSLDELTGAALFFKCEHLQRTGAFKFRGARHAIATLPAAQHEVGVATHSSGNHGAALACAAMASGIRCIVVVPEDVSAVKLANIERYGGEIRLCEPTLEARESVLAGVVAETGAAFVHPYDNAAVIAGQGTATLELMEVAGSLDDIVTPVGGGGLLAGAALAADGHALVWGAEPVGADDAARSFRAGTRVTGHEPDTICDGLRTLLGELNFHIIGSRCAGIVTASDQQTLAALRLLWGILKQVVEPSAAVTLAAILASPERFRGRRVGVVLSGGNADINAIAGMD